MVNRAQTEFGAVRRGGGVREEMGGRELGLKPPVLCMAEKGVQVNNLEEKGGRIFDNSPAAVGGICQDCLICN